MALIGAAISLSEGWLGFRQLGRMFATDLTVTVTNSSLGLVAALIVSTEPWALPLLVVPLLTVFLAYRAYVTERKRGERLEFLYEANRTLSRSPEIAEALEGLLARSLDAFRAERAEIILWTPDKPPLRTTLGPGDHKEVMAEVDPEVAVDLQSLVSNDMPVVTLPDAAHGSAIAAYLQERGVQKAMLAMLPGEDRVIGTLMLSNRYGVVRDFSADDLKLFETLANNASVALQYDRLEQAIARLKDLQQQLRHQAFHDSLTDLPNRALFISSVREALDTAPEELAVLFIDVDDFKTVNDTLGHAVGDELLVGVADRLRSCVRPQDEIARLGGDEFAVRLHDAVDAEGAAESVAKRIMEAFQLPIEAGGELLSIRLSVGIASARQGASDEDELIRHADMAMYQAKMAGKACFERFDPEAQAVMLHRRQMKDDLRRAVDTGELTVHYQPIVALATGDAAAAEALVRWEHPERGRIMPAEFIPLAEETGMIVAIGRFVLREACLQARRWQDEKGVLRSVHVNLSALELRQSDLIPTGARRDRGGRHRPVGPRAGDHREPAARGRRAQRRGAARAARARRAPRARRLRHGLLLAELPALAAAGHPQDRQAVRRPRGGGLARLVRADDDRPRQGARARGHRRGHRDGRAGRGAARAAVQLRAGLLPRPPRGRSYVGPGALIGRRRQPITHQEGAVQGKPVARRGRKARGLAWMRDGPAAKAHPPSHFKRHGGRPVMNKPLAPGRIRWAILCLALAATGVAPATGRGCLARRGHRADGRRQRARRRQGRRPRRGRQGDRRAADHQRLRRRALLRRGRARSRTPTASRPSPSTTRSSRRASASRASRRPTRPRWTRRRCGTTRSPTSAAGASASP